MPERDPLTNIASDIYQLRLPLPFALNHVNVYLLHGQSGWTILDCGINWDKGRNTWHYAFETLGISGANIEKIIITHVHPDHFGLAGWLYQLAKDAGRDIGLYLSPREDKQMQSVWRGERMDFSQWMQDNGMPDEMANAVSDSMDNTFDMTLPHPPLFQHIEAGTKLQMGSRDFMPYHAPGHSDGQLIFYDESDKLLLSGDHVLMKITPNIGLWRDTDPDPLGQFMDSIRSLRRLDVRLALPGHRRLIEDWSGRIDELLLHHEHRLACVIDALEAGNHTPFAVASRIFETERFSFHEWRFAIAETLAHLEYLRVEGTITQEDEAQIFTL